MKSMQFRGRWVLVTGASSGLGRAMAVLLAREHGANIMAVARRTARLDELRAELEGAYGVQVHAVAADLSRPEEVERVVRQASADHKLYAAILNAGLTYYGKHFGLGWDAFQTMLQVNVLANVRLTTSLLARIEENGEEGGVMLVASLAGITPVPYQTAYSSTKAFLVHFGCGLWHELQDRKVSITTYAPGGVATAMTADASFIGLRRWLVPVEGAAREGVEALRRRAYLHVPGALNRVGLRFAKLLPSRFVTGRVGAVYRRSLELATKGEKKKEQGEHSALALGRFLGARVVRAAGAASDHREPGGGAQGTRIGPLG